MTSLLLLQNRSQNFLAEFEMAKQTEIKLTIEGRSLSYKCNIDENTASKIASVCMRLDNNEQYSIDSGNPSKTARECLLSYKPSNNQNKILVLAYFLKEVKKVDTFQQAQINELFRESGEQHPANLSMEFVRLLRKGWIAKAMKKGRASNKKPMYFITNTGLEVLNNRFAKVSMPKSKHKNDYVTYIDVEHIQNLKKLSGCPWDFSRLVQLLSELNEAFAAEHYNSVIFLVRAILDHVSPIFGYGKFPEVANNYGGGGRSFSDCMQQLDKLARKHADYYLHQKIRRKEMLPNKTQVNFSPSVDILLAEIIRITSKPSD